MTPDLRDYARLLLRREPTRSLPVGVLRERLHTVAGYRTSAPQLQHQLDMDPCFRILCPPPLLQAPGSGYAPEQLAAGFPQPEPQVLLVEDTGADEGGDEWLGATGDSLLVLLGRDGSRGEVAEAVAAMAEIGAKLAQKTSPTPDAGARSTTPPPGPRPPRGSQRRSRPRSTPPPRKGGCH